MSTHVRSFIYLVVNNTPLPSSLRRQAGPDTARFGFASISIFINKFYQKIYQIRKHGFPTQVLT